MLWVIIALLMVVLGYLVRLNSNVNDMYKDLIQFKEELSPDDDTDHMER